MANVVRADDHDPGPAHLLGRQCQAGATVDIWISGLDGYRDELFGKDLGVFGPALGVPPIAETHWGARVLTMPDPFGNHLRISEPIDRAAHVHLPVWGPPASRE